MGFGEGEEGGEGIGHIDVCLYLELAGVQRALRVRGSREVSGVGRELGPPPHKNPHQQQHEVGEDVALLVHVHTQQAVEQAADVTPWALLLLLQVWIFVGVISVNSVNVHVQQAV